MPKDPYKPRSSVQEYYSVLFKLPSLRLIILYLVAVYTILLAIAYKTGFLLNYIYSVFALYTLYTAICIIYRSPLATAKRILGTILVSTIFSIPFTWVTWALGLPGNVAFLIGYTASLSLLIVLHIGIHGFSYREKLSAAAITYISLTTTSIIYSIEPVYGVVSATVFYIFTLLIYSIINRYKINGIEAITLGSLFLRNWLADDKAIEKVFAGLGEEKEIYGYVLYGCKIAVVHPDIHYGPFRNTGSSEFPSLLRRELKKRDIVALVLHGMGSHERNIATSQESLEYIEKIVNAIARGEGQEVLFAEPFKISLHGWEALVLPTTSITLVLLSRPGKGIDDIPYVVQEYAFTKASSAGLKPIVLVDSHNWELSEAIETNELLELVDMIIERLKNISDYYTPVISVKPVSIRGPGIIDDIVVLIITIGGIRTAIIYISGNNMEPGLRNKIIEEVRNLGLDYVEVLTNDEHKETGLKPGAVYTPVQYCPELLEEISASIKELLRDSGCKGLSYVVVKAKVTLMGNSVWRLMGLLKKVFPRAVALNLFYVIVAPIISITPLLLS